MYNLNDVMYGTIRIAVLWSGIVLLVCEPNFSKAESVNAEEMLKLDVDVYSSQGPTFNIVSGTGRAYYFNATLRVAEGGFHLPCIDVVGASAACAAEALQPQGDFYFGVIVPGGTVLSWVPDDDGEEINPRQGLIPISTDLDLSQEFVFDVNDDVGQALHAFTVNDPNGMYSIFALLVKSGQNPGDAKNWLGAEMQPLIVEAYNGPRPGPVVDNPAVPPAETADATIIFTSSKDMMFLANEADSLLEGSIESLSGAVPTVIIVPAGTWIRALEEGVPVNMYLKKFPDKDAYYPIYIGG